MVHLFIAILLLATTAAHADDSIPYRTLDSQFKGGIIVFQVEVYEHPLQGLPTEQELAWVANNLIGHRKNDPRRKLVQFYLQDMDLDSGVYATAELDDGPLEVERMPWFLLDHPQYGKYVDENWEFIKSALRDTTSRSHLHFQLANTH